MALARFQHLASRLEQIGVMQSGSMTKSYENPVPAESPSDGAPDYGGGERFRVNSNSRQLRLNVRAPEFGGASSSDWFIRSLINLNMTTNGIGILL